jgi:hypothetical protein
VFENRELRIFEPKRDEVTGRCRNCMKSFMIHTPGKIFLWKSNKRGWNGWSM